MAIKKRRQSDIDARGTPSKWEVPHHILYPTMGFVIGMGSPVGAFILRYLMANPVLKLLWMHNEWEYNYLFYMYMAVGTITSFMLFGYVIGLYSEKQRVSNRILNARVDELHLKSVTDGLTGAYTHGYLHEVLELEIQNSLTNKHPLSVLILDIDDFKKINDGHGHLFGDRVIKETAETIAANIRSEDILGRYGGDEFLIIMPGADAQTAKAAAQRLCQGVAKNGFFTTVSIGTTTFSGHKKQSAQELIHFADANLYHAKRQGKNQVSTEIASAGG